MFNLNFPTEHLRGAGYNPRAIASDALQRLQESISTVGFAKPIIVTQDGLIVAGHQRTKASRAMGRPSVPAWVLKEITTYDEIRFNQLHNGTDLDDIDHPVTVPRGAGLGFAEVPGKDVGGNLRSVGAVVRTEICALLLKYGNWGGAVATLSGVVVSGQQYALSCKLTGTPCRVFYIEDEKEQAARGYFGAQYGEFSYEHLPRSTWVQTFAQMMRLRHEDGEGKNNRSTLYEELVLPHVTKHDRILDFGCGQGDYVRSLKARGYRIQGMEFFFRKGNNIDTGAVHRMVDDLCRSLRMDGPFDAVVCDSVLNSTDCLQAEQDVMTCCAALAKPGGLVFMSGRRMARQESRMRFTSLSGTERHVEFLDKDGFTALFRKGAWFYQKFHTEAQARELLERWVGPCLKYQDGSSTSFQMMARRTIEHPQEVLQAAITREFNLPWPGGQSVDRGAKVWSTYTQAMARIAAPKENP